MSSYLNVRPCLFNKGMQVATDDEIGPEAKS